MMIGVPSGHIVPVVAGRSELFFLVWADTVAVAAKTRAARASITVLDNCALMAFMIALLVTPASLD